jgi:hypothetical protein
MAGVGISGRCIGEQEFKLEAFVAGYDAKDILNIPPPS